jgi:hypothetical protein
MQVQRIVSVLFLLICMSACSNRIVVRLPNNTLEPSKIIMYNYYLHRSSQDSLSNIGLSSPSFFIIEDTLKIYYPDSRVEMFTKDSVYITGKYAVVEGDTLKMASFYYYKDGILMMVEGYHYGGLTRRFTHIKGNKYERKIFRVGIVPVF